MYIKCPNCQTCYNIKSQTLPPEGRNMRCAKCHHIWHALPPQTEEFPSETPIDTSAFRFAFERPHKKIKKSFSDIFSYQNILESLIVLLMLIICTYAFYSFL